MSVSEPIIRRWKFWAEFFDDEDDGIYLNEDDIFIGTSREAAQEADKRSNEYEEKTGRLISKVIYESQGKVE